MDIDLAIHERWYPWKFICEMERCHGIEAYSNRSFMVALVPIIGEYCILWEKYPDIDTTPHKIYEMDLKTETFWGFDADYKPDSSLESCHYDLEEYFKIVAEIVISNYMANTSHEPLIINLINSLRSNPPSYIYDIITDAFMQSAKRHGVSFGVFESEKLESGKLKNNTVYIRNKISDFTNVNKVQTEAQGIMEIVQTENFHPWEFVNRVKDLGSDFWDDGNNTEDESEDDSKVLEEILLRFLKDDLDEVHNSIEDEPEEVSSIRDNDPSFGEISKS